MRGAIAGGLLGGAGTAAWQAMPRITKTVGVGPDQPGGDGNVASALPIDVEGRPYITAAAALNRAKNWGQQR